MKNLNCWEPHQFDQEGDDSIFIEKTGLHQVQPTKKLNCWEFHQCNREGDDSIFKEIDTCPASIEHCTHEINDGKNGGRACWVIAGSFSRGEVLCTCAHADKSSSCVNCDFYKIVQLEEGSRFITGSELAIQLLY
jgi:hypothetical protein